MPLLVFELVFDWALAAVCSATDLFTPSEVEEITFEAFCMAATSVLLPSRSFWAASIALASASRVDSSATWPAEPSSNVFASAMAFCNAAVVLFTSKARLLASTAVAAAVTALVCSLILLICLLMLRACARSVVSDSSTEHPPTVLRFCALVTA